MKNNLTAILLCCVCFSTAIAQTFQTAWENTNIQLPYGTMTLVDGNPPFLAYQSILNGNKFMFVSLEGAPIDTVQLPGSGVARYHEGSEAIYTVWGNQIGDSAMITKVGMDGNIKWVRKLKVEPSFFTTGITINFYENDILMGYFLADYPASGQKNANGYCVFDSEADLKSCSEVVYSPGSYDEIVHLMKPDSFGDMIAIRTPTDFFHSGPISVLKFDGVSGEKLWSTDLVMAETHSPSESAIAIDKDGSIFVGSAFNRLFKLSPNGQIIYNKPIAAHNYHSVRELHLRDDYLLILGSWKPTAEFDSVGGAYLAKVYAPSGEVVWELELPRLPEPTNIILESFGSGVWYSDSILYCTYKTNNVGRLCKLILPGMVTGTEGPKLNPQNLIISPNPANEWITVQIPSETTVFRLSILDVLGREVYKTDAQNGISLDITSLRNGYYILKAKSQDGKIGFGRFLKG